MGHKPFPLQLGLLEPTPRGMVRCATGLMPVGLRRRGSVRGGSLTSGAFWAEHSREKGSSRNPVIEPS